MSHRKVAALGVYVYDELGTQYNWTARALGDQFSTVSETMEEDVLEFVHSDITVKLDDEDGVVSGLLMGLGATSKWRLEVWRNPASWLFLWSGTIDATTIERDYADKSVSFTAYSHSKLLDLTTAEDVKRTVTGITGSTTIDTTTLTVSDGTNIFVDDEVELSTGSYKEKRRLVTKAGNSFEAAEPWKNSFVNAQLTLLTPYYRDKSPAELAALLFTKSGMSSVRTRPDTIALEHPYPGRMNSAGLDRRSVDCVSRRGSNIAVFENDAAYYATSPTSGFSTASYTPTHPSDWTPYVGSESNMIPPNVHKDIDPPGGAAASNDDGQRITGNQSTYYWYIGYDTIGAGPTYNKIMYLKDSSGTRQQEVDRMAYNSEFYDGEPYWRVFIEYNATESRIWVSYEGFMPDGVSTGRNCKAYNGATMLQDGTRPVLGGSGLRYNYIGPHMIEFGADYINVRAAATPYASVAIIMHVPNLIAWTFRRISFDATPYWCCIQRRPATEFGKYEWWLILWSYTSGEVVSEEKIAAGYAITRCNGSVWYDPVGVDDVYLGYVELEEVGGQYFYVTKAGSNVVPYADFKGKSCADALRDLAISSGSVIRVDRNKVGYFIGRNSLAAEFGSAPVAISDPLKKVKRSVWEWYRSSAQVTGRAPVTGDEFTALVGDTGNTQFRLEMDAEYVASPGLARALATNYVTFLDNTNGQLDVVVLEPTSGPVELFHRVTLDGVTYRVFKTENDYGSGEQALTLVQE